MLDLAAEDVRGSRDRTKRRAIRLSAVTFIIALILQVALGSRTAVVWSMALAAYIWYRAVRVDRVIVWLRRFHRGDRNRLRFNRVLGVASLGLGVPITIQDSSYKTSYEHAFARSVFLYPLAVGFSVVPVLGGFLLAMPLGIGEDLWFWVGFGFALPLLGAYIYGVKKLLERRGITTLSGPAGLERARAELASIRAGKRSSYGVRVCACDDSIWKEVVESYLKDADAVVVDITELTENLVWELRIAEATVGTGSLLLACGYDGDEPLHLPPDVARHVEHVIPPDRLAQHAVFFYPNQVPRLGFAANSIYQALTRTLSDRLAQCVTIRDARRGTASVVSA